MIARFRVDDLNDRHARVTLFTSATASSEHQTLGNSGALVLDREMWDELARLLPTTIGSITIYPPLP